MERADLLYSGLILAALMLSVWTAMLLTAVCWLFAPALFSPAFLGSASNNLRATRQESGSFERPACSKLAARSS